MRKTEVLFIIAVCSFLFFGQTSCLDDAVEEPLGIVVFVLDLLCLDKHPLEVFSLSNAGFRFSKIIISIFCLFDYTNKFEFGHYFGSKFYVKYLFDNVINQHLRLLFITYLLTLLNIVTNLLYLQLATVPINHNNSIFRI